MNIRIFFKDGTTKDFPHVGRAGGSYTKQIKYDCAMVIVTDEYYKTYAYPTDLIERVETTPNRY